MARKMKAWESELRDIAAKHRGLLQPDDVVRFAENPRAALHSKFTWGDTEAAHKWRLLEARNLIAVAVLVLPGSNKSFRAFVSMVNDRKNAGGGYRSLVSVLSDRNLRCKLLEQALADLLRWQEKYENLKELAPVFVARKTIRQSLVAQERIAVAG